MPFFKHEACCPNCVFAGSILSTAATVDKMLDVYVCTDSYDVYIRDAHAPASDQLLGNIDHLISDIKHSLKVGNRYVHAYLLASDLLNSIGR